MATLISLFFILVMSIFSAQSTVTAQSLPLYERSTPRSLPSRVSPDKESIGQESIDSYAPLYPNTTNKPVNPNPAMPVSLDSLEADAINPPAAVRAAWSWTSDPAQSILAGTDRGLFQLRPGASPVPLWTEGGVTKIEEVPLPDGQREWFFITTKGLYKSRDLVHFEKSDAGIAALTLKVIRDNKAALVQQAQAFKDFSVHPEDPNIMVLTGKKNVYLSRDRGKTWRNLGFSSDTTGAKAVATASLPTDTAGKKELVVFLAHPIQGFAYIKPDDERPSWHTIAVGLDASPTPGSFTEIADILPLIEVDDAGKGVTSVYLSQTFSPTIYRLNWREKRMEKVYRGTEALDSIDGLYWTGEDMLFTSPGSVLSYNPRTSTLGGPPGEFDTWQGALKSLEKEKSAVVNSIYIPQNLSGYGKSVILNELWMLSPEKMNTPYGDAATGRKSVYMHPNSVASEERIKEYLKIIEDNRLNSVVIDMKDEAGLLRYDSRDPEILKKAKTSLYSANLDTFTATFKAKKIYLIARIVVFKDHNLVNFDEGKYAVWDSKNDRAWLGIRSKNAAGRTTYYNENWVDPYSEDVWEYNVRIAKELISRGFDEIQFDYIRFPTDGQNISDVKYRWHKPGMDRDSAIMSFLKYARENIEAPIGIDVYGNNGWYRSGQWTGQDVEMLADYVDVICPMYYPSHFEQTFLAHNPAEERPYRIYYYGTYRATMIARNKVVVRPWVQAFQIGASYDNLYYNKNYVSAQVYGVRNSVNRGYMYWNNMGRYDDISPDVGDISPYKGSESTAASAFNHNRG